MSCENEEIDNEEHECHKQIAAVDAIQNTQSPSFDGVAEEDGAFVFIVPDFFHV